MTPTRANVVHYRRRLGRRLLRIEGADRSPVVSDEIVQLLSSIGMSRPGAAPQTVHADALPHAALSYALAGEDIALRKLFKRQIMAGAHGIYVDVGCSAPISLSNTYHFYCLGWRGLGIDANIDAASHWAEARPGDRFVHAAVSSSPGEKFYFRHRTNLGMHRVCETPAPPEGDFTATPETVSARRLDDIFKEYLGERPIDIMSMDIEGVELDALRSNDWQRWRPKVILVECVEFNIASPAQEDSIRFLLGQGYKIRSRIDTNVILTA